MVNGKLKPLPVVVQVLAVEQSKFMQVTLRDLMLMIHGSAKSVGQT